MPSRSGFRYAYNVNGTATPGMYGWGLGIGGERMLPNTVVSTSPNSFRPNKEKEILRPSDMIAFGDSYISRVYGNATPPPGGWPYPEFWGDPYFDDPTHADFGRGGPPWDISIQQRRHGTRYNVAFCDGHIEYTRCQLLYARQDDRLRRWNNDNLPHRETLPR